MSKLQDLIVKGRITEGYRLFIYGQHGIGKSTFAASAPEPLFLDPQMGTKYLDCERIPVGSWESLNAVTDMFVEDTMGFKTLVIDELGALEQMLWSETAAAHNKKSIEDFGYGKGYVIVEQEWRKLMVKLNSVSELGVNVILIGHSEVRGFKNPTGGDYDRYQVALHKKASPIISQWADAVLFCQYKTYAAQHVSDDNRYTGISTGERVICTGFKAEFDAKNRFDLPAEMPLEWEAFERYVQPIDPAAIEQEIRDILSTWDEGPKKDKALEYVAERSGHAGKLSKLLNKVKES